MLLDGIYYGKTPISRAYKNGQIIWSLGEDKNLEVNINFGPHLISRITPEAARQIVNEYKLSLSNEIVINYDESGPVPVKQFILSDSSTNMGLQGAFSLTPYAITFLFDVIGNLQESHSIVFQCYFTNNTPAMLEQADAKIAEPNASVGIAQNEMQFTPDKSYEILTTESVSYDTAALEHIVRSKAFNSEEQINFNAQILNSLDRAGVVFVHSSVEYKTLNTLISSASQAFDMVQKASLIFANALNLDAAKSPEAIQGLQMDIAVNADNDKSVSFNSNEITKADNVIDMHHAQSDTIAPIVDSDMTIIAFADLNDTQAMDAIAQNQIYIFNKYKEASSKCIIAEWPGQLKTYDYLYNAISKGTDAEARANLTALFMGSASESHPLHAEYEALSLNANNLKNSMVQALTIWPEVKISLLDGLNFSPSHIFTLQKNLSHIFKLNISNSEAIGLNPIYISEFNATPLLVNAPETKAEIDGKINSDISSAEFSISDIHIVPHINQILTSKLITDMFLSKGLQTNFFSSLEQAEFANLLISQCLDRNFYTQLDSNTLTSNMEMYFPQEIDFIKINNILGQALFKIAKKAALAANNNINATTTSANLRINPINESLNAHRQCALNSKAILSFVKWELPQKQETNLFITQAFETIQLGHSLDIK